MEICAWTVSAMSSNKAPISSAKTNSPVRGLPTAWIPRITWPFWLRFPMLCSATAGNFPWWLLLLCSSSGDRPTETISGSVRRLLESLPYRKIYLTRYIWHHFTLSRSLVGQHPHRLHHLWRKLRYVGSRLSIYTNEAPSVSILTPTPNPILWYSATTNGLTPYRPWLSVLPLKCQVSLAASLLPLISVPRA